MTSTADAVRRIVSLIAAILVHAFLLFFASATTKTGVIVATGSPTLEDHHVPMKIADIREARPQTSRAFPTPAAEPSAETITAPDNAAQSGGGDDFLPAYLVSQLPRFSGEALKKRVRYPPLAQRAGIEGTVYLEIFVDRTGAVQNVTVLKEEPEGRGFGDAAANVFTGLTGSPALANGKETAVRYRYPVRFSLR